MNSEKDEFNEATLGKKLTKNVQWPTHLQVHP